MGLLEAAVAGIAPALAAFYLTFDSYDRVISDRGLFIALFVGMVLGFVYAVPESLGLVFLDPFLFGPETNLDLIARAVLSVFTIAFIHEGLRVLILNVPAIRGKWQQPFWGMSLGLGAGAVFGLWVVATGGPALEDPVNLLQNVPFLVALVLAHGAFGGLVGLGVSERRAVRGFFIASVGHMAFNGLILAERVSAPLIGSEGPAAVAQWVLIGVMLAYAFVLYRHMVRQLPKMLPKAKQTKRRRRLREAEA